MRYSSGKFLQEVEKKARKQFQGLFDKKPGEIAEARAEDKECQTTNKPQEDGERKDSDETNSVESHEAEPDQDAPRMGWFSLFWPASNRLFSALGLQRCTIL